MPSDELPRRASDARFAGGRAELAGALRGLLGAHAAPEPVGDADHAAALAAEARAGHRAAEAHAWAVVRHAWPGDDRGGVSELLHAVSALLAARPCWWIVPGREPQAVPLASDAVLDNPFGFAALAEGHELVLLDAELPAGLWLGHPPHDAAGDGWAVEVWGTEPWLSAATRALREWRARRDAR